MENSDISECNCRNNYAVVIGDANVDIAATARFAIRQDSALPCNGVMYKRGGGPRNVAENLARLGCDTRLISVFGDDIQGQELMRATAATGVDLSHALVSATHATGTYLIVNQANGENFCTIGDPSNVAALTPDWLRDKRTLLQDAALIITNATLTEETLTWLFANHGDCPVYLDTIGGSYAERIRPWLSSIHTLKPNRAEASLLSGLPFASREDAVAIAQWFHAAGVRQVVLSLGEYGLYFSNGQFADWMAPLPVKVVNVTGAGDALLAGLAYGRLTGLDSIATMRFALGCAAMTLTTHENNHPELSPQTVQALLDSQ